jgi:C4-dicarboxylate-specific signal transduction histidine kinase
MVTDLGDYRVSADEKMVERSLINLYLNAIHALTEQENKVITTTVRTHNNRIIVSIMDNGSGVPSKIKTKYFCLFSQQGTPVPEWTYPCQEHYGSTWRLS